MQPAIELARQGVALTYDEAQSMHNKELADFADSKRIFQRNGNFYEPGERFRQPELARTLERIAAKPDDFYKGDLARQLAAAVHRGEGLITPQDLAQYAVQELQPIRAS